MVTESTAIGAWAAGIQASSAGHWLTSPTTLIVSGVVLAAVVGMGIYCAVRVRRMVHRWRLRARREAARIDGWRLLAGREAARIGARGRAMLAAPGPRRELANLEVRLLDHIALLDTKNGDRPEGLGAEARTIGEQLLAEVRMIGQEPDRSRGVQRLRIVRGEIDQYGQALTTLRSAQAVEAATNPASLDDRIAALQAGADYLARQSRPDPASSQAGLVPPRSDDPSLSTDQPVTTQLAPTSQRRS
jgi:hypothetical protein